MATISTTTSAALPAVNVAATGKAYFLTDNNKFVVNTGSAWIEVHSDGTGAVAFQNRWGASFNGSTDHISFASNPNLDMYTLSFWFKSTENHFSLPIAGFGESGISQYGGVRFVPAAPGRAIEYNAGDGAYYIATGNLSNSEVFDDAWHHVAIVYVDSNYTTSTGTASNNGKGYKIFFDGNRADTTLSLTSHNWSLATTSSFFSVGKERTDYFEGQMDEVAVFGSSLTDANIATIYNSGVPGNLSSFSPTLWLRMGDDSNDSPVDGSSITGITNSANPGTNDGITVASAQPTFKALAQSATSSVSFDGSNDYLTVTQNSDINITGDLTVSAWVNLDNTSGYNAILTKRQVGGSMNYQFTIDHSGKIGLGHSGGDWVYDTNSLTVGTWHHVAATVSSGTVQFYIDGVAKSSSSGLTITGDTNDMSIGATPGYNYFSGKIDEVAVFNTALTQPNITSLATSQTAHIKDDLSLTPVAYYRMGEDDSLTDGDIVTGITDASGNGHHATTVATVQPTASVEPIIYV
jgi:hypothetical protein